MIPEMESMGVKKELIYPFGIPVGDVFFSKGDKPMLQKKFGIDADLPTILIMAGSFGVTNIMSIYKDLIKLPADFQIIVITGRNQRLFDAFSPVITQSPKKTTLVYYTDEVEDYMHVSDLIITKPGGLTVSEALACNIPLAVFDAIPGQEEDNANFLLSHDMAVKLEKGVDPGKTILSLLDDSKKLERMRASLENFDKSQSSKNIFSLINELCEKNQK